MSDFVGNLARARAGVDLAESIHEKPRVLNEHEARLLAGEYLRARSVAKALNEQRRKAQGWIPAPEIAQWPIAAPTDQELAAMADAGFARAAAWCRLVMDAALTETPFDG